RREHRAAPLPPHSLLSPPPILPPCAIRASCLTAFHRVSSMVVCLAGQTLSTRNSCYAFTKIV
ncbi:hypothetical protein PMAYCL1PPCAC_19344, partial [Pristionchus mayeri]